MKAQELIKWLHDTPVEDIKGYASKLEGIIEELKVDAEQYVRDQDAESLEETITEIKEKQKLYRMIRGYYDVLFFAYEYFSDDNNPENETNLIPAGVGIDDAPHFHIELCSKLDELNTEKRTKKIGWGAPRGSGKSAYLTNIEPTHAVIYQTRKYIIIISETVSMSQNFLEFVSTNLKLNAKLRGDFGEVLSVNNRHNELDNNEAFVTHTSIKVQATSMGGQLRGSRFKSYRPDLILCDDLESSKNTNTQDLREKNLHWFNSVIEPIGDPTTTAIVYMGTLVHGQGLLPNVVNRPEYDSKIYSSIIEDPINMDMWINLENMLRNVDDPDRLYTAEKYYYENKEAMDEGIKVLWEDRFSYFDLIKKKVDVGSRAFASEYLNKPSDAESSIFKEGYITYYDLDDLYNAGGSKKQLEIYGFWDIAMGKNRRSDYNAITIIGRDTRTGIVYVLEAWAKKCPPSEAMAQALEFIEQYRPKVFGVETIQAQFEFYRQLQEIAVKRGYYFTRIKPVNPYSKKEERIEAMEPLFEQGYIRIRKQQRLLEEMLVQFPNHSHDDLPDCLASTIGLTRINRQRAYYSKPEGF